MKNEPPLISVITPCYNYAHFLPETAESVLQQKHTRLEYIIVNDGSSDNTEEVAKKYCKLDGRVKYVKQDNQGLPAARNTGISMAKGTYILPLDADDTIAPDYASKAVEVLENSPNTGIVYCETRFFGSMTGIFKLPPYSLPEMLINNLIPHAGFFRREDWVAGGGYNTIMKLGWEDYDFWLSIIELGREVYKIPEELYYYRQGHASMRDVTNKHQAQLHAQLVRNHPALYLNNIACVFERLLENGAGRQAFDEIEKTVAYRWLFKYVFRCEKAIKARIRTAAEKAGIMNKSSK
jgi:glycosyltransferase involved in cell wall biosynthesis